MNPVTKKQVVTVARWAARILSVLLLGIVAAFVIGEGGPNPFAMPPREQAISIALAAMLIGLAAAWIWEGWGGLFIVSGFVAFAIVNGRLPTTSLTNPLWMMLLAGLLFLLCWWKTPPAEALSEAGLGGKVQGALSRWFYRLTLPAVWLSATLVSWHHPGDEYGLFLVSCLPAMWIVPFANVTHFLGALPILVAGSATMSLVGCWMDRLHVGRTVWIALLVCGAVAFVLCALGEYPSYPRAIAKNGSLIAYMAAATNLGLYLSVIVTTVSSPLRRTASIAHRYFTHLRRRP